MIQSKSDNIQVKVKSEQTPQISERIPFLFVYFLCQNRPGALAKLVMDAFYDDYEEDDDDYDEKEDVEEEEAED